MVDFRSAYDGKRVPVYAEVSDKQITKQSFKNQADINKIVAKFVKQGQTPPLPSDLTFGFAPPYTFHEAVELVRNADSYFMELPAQARNRFQNDPGAFLAFIDDPANRDDLYAMGILEKAVEAPGEPEPGPTPVVPEPENPA